MINAGFRDDSNITSLMCATWLHIIKNFVKFVEELMLSNRLIFNRRNTSDSDWKCRRAKTGRIQIESDRIEPNTNLSKFWCWYSPAGVVPTHQISIFHKVWSKVIEYGESESDVSFRWKSCFTAACKIYYLVFSLGFFENSWKSCLVFTADIMSG